MFGQVINTVGKIADFGHKYGKGFGKRAAHPYPIFLGVFNIGTIFRPHLHGENKRFNE